MDKQIIIGTCFHQRDVLITNYTHHSRLCHYLDLGSASDWLKQIFNQTEALLKSRS